MSCANPIDAAVLADYWVAALPQTEEEAVEEHLFTCDECAARLSEITALAEGVRSLARGGSLQMIVSDAFLKRAAEEGLRVRQYAPAAGGSVQCTVTPEDDLLIGRLAANLAGVRQVDLSICNQDRVEQMRMTDIPFRSEGGDVVIQQSITWAKAAPTETLIVRMLDHDEAGGERLLGEYTFNHTRTMPGPPGW